MREHTEMHTLEELRGKFMHVHMWFHREETGIVRTQKTGEYGENTCGTSFKWLIRIDSLYLPDADKIWKCDICSYGWHFFFSMIFLRKNLRSKFFVFLYKLLHGLSWLTEKLLLILSWLNCGFDFKVKAVYSHTHGKSSQTYVPKCQWYSSMFSYQALDTHECAHTHLLQNRWEKLRGAYENTWKTALEAVCFANDISFQIVTRRTGIIAFSLLQIYVLASHSDRLGNEFVWISVNGFFFPFATASFSSNCSSFIFRPSPGRDPPMTQWPFFLKYIYFCFLHFHLSL